MSLPYTAKPPAPEGLLCCWTAVNTGGDECDCWEPVLATQEPVGLVDQAPVQEGPACARRIACHDCAYRPGSPERAELGGDLPTFTRRERFYCHDGMPFIIAWRHPSGAFVQLDLTDGVVDYHPVISTDRTWRTDGRPAVLCAGWASVNGIPRADPAVQPASEVTA